MRIEKIMFLTFLTMVLPLGGSQVFAKELTANDVFKKALLAGYYSGRDETSDVKMTIFQPTGQVIGKEFKLSRLNDNEKGVFKTYLDVTKPQEDRLQLVFLRKPGQQDKIWQNGPGVNQMVEISGKTTRAKFSDSQFVYEDISGPGFDGNRCQFMDLAIEDHYWMKCSPKNNSNKEFKYFYVWIRKDNFIPIKFEFYDSKNTLLRLVEVLDIEEVHGYHTPIEILVKNLVGGGQTTIQFSNIRYDVGLKEDMFALSDVKR